MPRFTLPTLVLILGSVATTHASEPTPITSTTEPADVGRPALIVTGDRLELWRSRRIVPIRGSGMVRPWVWTPAGQVWSASTEGSALLLNVEIRNDDPRPHWRSLDPIVLDGLETLQVRVTGAPNADPTEIPPMPALMVLRPIQEGDLDLSAAELPETTATLDRLLSIVRADRQTVRTVDDTRRAVVRTNQSGADFQAPSTAEAWNARAEQLRDQLRIATGLWPPLPKTPLQPRLVKTQEHDDHIVETYVLETLPGHYLAGSLYRPIAEEDGSPPRRAAVLCPHGHWSEGRRYSDVRKRCIQLARLGFLAFAYDMVGYNDSESFGHRFLDDTLRRWGLSLVTLQTWNSVRVLDWLQSRADVDPARIGCTGASGGGTQTFLLAALDPRVRVAAPVVMVSEGFQGGCYCENADGLRFATDNVEFAALIAPRPLKLVGARGDWTVNTLTEVYPRIKRVYQLVGDPSSLDAERFDFDHNYNQTSRNAVYPFLVRWLQGRDEPLETIRESDEAAGAELSDGTELLVDGEVRALLDNAKSPNELADALIAARRDAWKSLRPRREDPIAWATVRPILERMWRIQTQIDVPASSDLSVELVDSFTLDDLQVTVSQRRIRRSETGQCVPVTQLRTAEESANAPSDAVILVGRDGRADLVDGEGRLSSPVRSLLDAGLTVVAFDGLFQGESFDSESPQLSRPATAHFATYNRSLAADRMLDLALVVAHVKALPGTREVHLVGQGAEGGALSLMARPTLTSLGLGRTFVDLEGFGFDDPNGALIPPTIDLPGVLQVGGLPIAAALTAPGPLWIQNPPQTPSTSWIADAYALADTPQLLTITTEPTPDFDPVARWIADGDLQSDVPITP